MPRFTTIPPLAPVRLQLSWGDDELLAWGWDGTPSVVGSRLVTAAYQVLGPLPRLGPSVPVAMHLPAGPTPVACLRLRGFDAVDALAAVVDGDRTSDAARFFARLARLAHLAVASRRVRPTVVLPAAAEVSPLLGVTAVGGGRLRWEPVLDESLDQRFRTLVDAAPPACFAAHPHPDRTVIARAALGALVDSIVRTTLGWSRWKPPVDGTRSALTAAARAVFGAGAKLDATVLVRHEQHAVAVERIARRLDQHLDRLHGVPVVSARARLSMPAHEQDDWRIGIELVDPDDTSRWCTAHDVWGRTPAAADLAGGDSAGGFAVLEAAVRRAADDLAACDPVLALLGADPQPGAVHLDLLEASAVLDRVDVIDRSGIPVLVPQQLVKAPVRVGATARPGSWSSSGGGQLGARALLDWFVTVDDQVVDEHVLERAAEAGAGLLAVNGRWVRIDPAWAKRMLERLANHRQHDTELDPLGLLRLLSESPDTAPRVEPGGGPTGAPGAGPPATTVSGTGWVGELLAGLPDARLEEAVEPSAFARTLRPYQRRALGWLQFLASLGLGGCLADDMGLGKTPTTLAHLASRPGPHLVVCPLSVVRNWQQEAGRFTPWMRVLVHHGGARARGDTFRHEVAQHDLVICTYGLAVRDVDDIASVRWTTLVLDEAQAIKNAHTRAARTARVVPAVQKVALTGTPVENRLGELWSILDAVNPGLLGSERRFNERWAAPIERDHDEDAAAHLRTLTSPFVLRRTKADKSLVPDLPDKVEQIAWATLTKEQATMYQAVVDQLLRDATLQTGFHRKGIVIAALTRLKQICNHPAHALGDGSRLGGRSGKLSRFDELVRDLLEADETALVFTQYREMGELLVRHLGEQFDLRVPFLHGGVAKSRRDTMVERFQLGEGPPLLLVSLRAGGTGLNLTAASRVIHYDRWWNPAVENQATDRAWRIGQDRTVFVHKLVCQGTVEERIAAIIDEKQQLAQLVVGTGEAWLSELSTDALRDLVRLGDDARGDR
jgi:hypothetical protein